MKTIIWLDPSLDMDDENKIYFKELNETENSKIYRLKTVKEGIAQINEIIFDETIIIVSGKLFKEFIIEFKKNLNNLCFVPNIIIFTANKNQFLLSLDNTFHNFIGDKFYNSGGVETDFTKVKEFIQNPKGNKKVILKRDSEEQFNFDYIDTIEKLELPLFYKYLIEFTEGDNNQFLNFLKEKYYNQSREIRNFLDSIASIPELPIQLLAKYYSRIYTDDESKFYKDLNDDLRNNLRGIYLPYIKVLYEGVRLKSLPITQEEELFRGAQLPKKEIDNFYEYSKKQKINGLPGPIVFSKTFLSFTKDKVVADNFLEYNTKSNKLYKTLFILKKDDNYDDNINYSLSTHADIEKISLMGDEKEVLFFPFSSFEIENIFHNKQKDIYEIRLLYLGKHLKKIETNSYIRENKKLPKTTFSEEIVQSGLIKRENLENNNSTTLHQKFQTNKINSVKIQNPIYQKSPIYPVSPLPRAPTLIYTVPQNNEIHPEYKKPYIFRRFNKPEDKADIYKPPEIEIPKVPVRPTSLNLKEVSENIIENKKENYIFAQFKITENDINKNIRIINSFEQNKLKYHYIKVDNELRYINEEEIKNKCKMKIDGKYFNPQYFRTFSKPGIYTIEYWFTSNLTKTDFLFAECFNLYYINLFNFRCEDVTNMACMFLECVNLKHILISNINTRKVEDMNCMFCGCQSLENLDLSFFNTQNVTNMGRLFFGCKSLASVNLSSFNTQNVTDMYGMFGQCISLKNLDLLNFYTQNIINMSRMFFYCSSLKTLNLSNFNTSKVAYMNSMFYGCSSLMQLDISNFNIENVVNMEDMFAGCYSLNIEKINCKNKGNLIKKSLLYK